MISSPKKFQIQRYFPGINRNVRSNENSFAKIGVKKQFKISKTIEINIVNS